MLIEVKLQSNILAFEWAKYLLSVPFTSWFVEVQQL